MSKYVQTKIEDLLNDLYPNNTLVEFRGIPFSLQRERQWWEGVLPSFPAILPLFHIAASVYSMRVKSQNSESKITTYLILFPADAFTRVHHSTATHEPILRRAIKDNDVLDLYGRFFISKNRGKIVKLHKYKLHESSDYKLATGYLFL